MAHSAMPARELGINAQDRAAYGVIVTAREQTSDQRIVLHRSGRDGLQQVCDVLDALVGDWRVLTVSTPATIYRDLQGTRAREWGAETQTPEPSVLGKVGRLDLLDPVYHRTELPRGQSHA